MAVKIEGISSQLEAERVAAALQKRKAGKKLTRAEINAIGRYERDREYDQLREALAAVPHPIFLELFDTSRKVQREWEMDNMPGAHQGRRKTYDLFRVCPWLKSRWRLQREAGREATAAKERLEEAKADIAEIARDKLRGKLVLVEKVESGRLARIFAVKTSLQRGPKMLKHRLAGKTADEVEEALSDWVAGVLDEFSEGGGSEGK